MTSRFQISMAVQFTSVTLFLIALSTPIASRALDVTFGGYSRLSHDDQNHPIIFAGTSGPDCGATPCNSCTQIPGSVKPLACNESRISTTGGVFSITFKATRAGKPLVTVGPVGRETKVFGQSKPVKVGDLVTMTQTWDEMCSNPAICTAGVTCTHNCSFNLVTREMNVGIDTTGDQGVLDPANDAAPFSVRVLKDKCDINDVDGALVSGCADPQNAGDGIWSFEMSPGNSEIFTQNVFSVPSFPQTANTHFEKIRYYYAEGNCGSVSLVRNSSKHFETDFTVDPRTDIRLGSNEFKGFTNGKIYVFKTAVVDEAGNISHFTPDQVCNNTPDENANGTTANPISAGKGIHVARPSAL